MQWIGTLTKSARKHDRNSWRKLASITREAEVLSKDIPTASTLLVGPPFSIYDPSFFHDRLLAIALRLRGLRLVAIYCDQIQEVECNVIGGVWGGEDFTQGCHNCKKRSVDLLSSTMFADYPLSKFLTDANRQAASQIVDEISENDWHRFTLNELPIGLWAKDILVNNYVVGDFSRIDGWQRLWRAHLKNLVLLKSCYENALDELKPDIVLTNDSYYGMWALMRELSRARSIPAYSYWPFGKERVAFAKNDAAMNLDFREAWTTFRDSPLSDELDRKVTSWLLDQGNERDAFLGKLNGIGTLMDLPELSGLSSEKKTALLAANVIWDLAALNRQCIFSDMMDWIAETIEWFRQHPQYQLVVKPHPTEVNSAIPTTRQSVASDLSFRGLVVPPNVVILDSATQLTIQVLGARTDVCITHTTTVGIELAAIGIPIIATGRSPYRGFGFTLDPSTREEYFAVLEDSLLSNTAPVRSIELAKKHLAFYMFHYYIKLGLIRINEFGGIPELLVNSAEDLMPGNNPHLDYVCESIMSKDAICSTSRWPPVSL